MLIWLWLYYLVIIFVMPDADCWSLGCPSIWSDRRTSPYPRVIRRFQEGWVLYYVLYKVQTVNFSSMQSLTSSLFLFSTYYFFETNPSISLQTTKKQNKIKKRKPWWVLLISIDRERFVRAVIQELTSHSSHTCIYSSSHTTSPSLSRSLSLSLSLSLPLTLSLSFSPKSAPKQHSHY
jgi:hypothetical protein